MRVLITSAAVLSLIAGVATTAGAQTCTKQFQLVGFTAGDLPSDTGVLGFTQACQAEFPASRMCSSVEVMQTVDMPVLPESTKAWVRPTFRPGGNGPLLDASGTESQSSLTLSCRGWAYTGNGYAGLAVDGNGRFDSEGCINSFPVACCSLLAVPEPSMSLLQGAAAATLGTLAAKRIPRSTSSSRPPS